jgi:hypothetical protein
METSSEARSEKCGSEDSIRRHTEDGEQNERILEDQKCKMQKTVSIQKELNVRIVIT